MFVISSFSGSNPVMSGSSDPDKRKFYAVDEETEETDFQSNGIGKKFIKSYYTIRRRMPT